jgi:hypothetical protein
MTRLAEHSSSSPIRNGIHPTRFFPILPERIKWPSASNTAGRHSNGSRSTAQLDADVDATQARGPSIPRYDGTIKRRDTALQKPVGRRAISIFGME